MAHTRKVHGIPGIHGRRQHIPRNRQSGPDAGTDARQRECIVRIVGRACVLIMKPELPWEAQCLLDGEYVLSPADSLHESRPAGTMRTADNAGGRPVIFRELDCPYPIAWHGIPGVARERQSRFEGVHRGGCGDEGFRRSGCGMQDTGCTRKPGNRFNAGRINGFYRDGFAAVWFVRC
jgi:hypothetical protein